MRINGVANNHTPFPTADTTFASLLRAAGFRTGYFGKWRVGSQRDRPGFAEHASYVGQDQYRDASFLVNGVMTHTVGWVDDVSTDYAIDFMDSRARALALDGQPVAPHEPEGGRVVLGPAQRADLVLDLTGAPGSRATVADTFYRGLEYRLLDLVYDAEPLRERPPDSPVALADNTMPEPDLGAAQRHEVVLGGGMMGGDPRHGRHDGRDGPRRRHDVRRHGHGMDLQRRRRHRRTTCGRCSS